MFQCDVCPKSYIEQHLLDAHTKKGHLTEEDKKFECDACGQR